MMWMTPSFFSSGTQSSRRRYSFLRLLSRSPGMGILSVNGMNLQRKNSSKDRPISSREILYFLHQEIFDGFLRLARLFPGAVQLFLLEKIAADQIVETGLPPPGIAFLVEEGDAEDVRDLLEKTLFILGEFTGSAFLVEDLDDPHERLVVEDRGGEDLLRPETGLLVPADVEGQFLVDLLKLLDIIGVGDVDDLPRIGHVPGDAPVVDGNPDLLDLGADEKHGIDFVARPVHHIDGDRMGVEEVQDPVLQIDEDLLDVLCGVDPVGDVQKGLANLELFFEFRDFFVFERVHHSYLRFSRH